MTICSLFESEKFMKICSKTHQIAPFKKNFRGSMPLNPPSKRLATSRISQLSPPKSWPPLANPAYAHGQLLKNFT